MKHRQKIVNRIEELGYKGRILEIGCGDGSTLALFEKNKWNTIGLDPLNKDATFNMEIEKAKFNKEEFDVILMINSLEHIENPHLVLRRIHGWLKEDGLLFVSVPNVNRVYVGNDRNKIFNKAHFSYFNPRSLRYVLKMNGFDVFDMSCFLGISNTITTYNQKELKS